MDSPGHGNPDRLNEDNWTSFPLFFETSHDPNDPPGVDDLSTTYKPILPIGCFRAEEAYRLSVKTSSRTKKGI